MKKTFLLLALLIVILLSSCSMFTFLIQLTVEEALGNGAFTVNIEGATAIAGTSSSTRSLGSRDVNSRLTEAEDAALVKFLEDGSVKSVISFDTDDSWTPDVAFISIGDDDSVYVGFSHFYYYSDGAGEKAIQLIRIYPESTTYDILWPPQDSENIYNQAQIDVWGWWGMDQDPMVKGKDGKLYFKVYESSSTGYPSHNIYVYDPVSANFPEKVTPENASLTISTFSVGAQGHLFIQSENYGDGSAAYLRYYTPGVTGYKNIYYSSTADMWVRGYTTNPEGNSLIMNGYNIRGMNGIIRANILGAQEVSYEILYSNANSGGIWINLYKYYSSTWENNTELIDQVSPSVYDSNDFQWRDDVQTNGSVDINKIYQKIAPYFYDAPILKAGVEGFVTGSLDASDSSHLIYPTVSIGVKLQKITGVKLQVPA